MTTESERGRERERESERAVEEAYKRDESKEIIRSV